MNGDRSGGCLRSGARATDMRNWRSAHCATARLSYLPLNPKRHDRRLRVGSRDKRLFLFWISAAPLTATESQIKALRNFAD
jgi:hypothetical protein